MSNHINLNLITDEYVELVSETITQIMMDFAIETFISLTINCVNIIGIDVGL